MVNAKSRGAIVNISHGKGMYLDKLESLNIGSGKTPYKEYPHGYKCTNFDIRDDIEDVDVVGDIRHMPKEWTSKFDYILAKDIIEHFTKDELMEAVLPELNRVLKLEGVIEVITPSLKGICTNYLSGRTNARKTSWLIFGAQNYQYNYHRVIFDVGTLGKLFEGFGFFTQFAEEGYGSNMRMIFKKVGNHI